MGFDPFKLESGLLGNVDVTIQDAEFINDPAYNNGQTLQAALTFLVEGDDGGERVENFSCGDGWETNDGGKTAVREDGREINFNGQSKIGLLFGGLVDVMGSDPKCDKVVRARAADHPLGPRDASFWKGLKLHLDRQDHNYGGEIGKKEVLVITGFNGEAGATKASGAAKKASGATKKAAAKPAKAEGGGVTDELRRTLDEIADASSDHDAFMEAAFAQVPEASSDDAVKAAVTDDGEGSIWQAAMARFEEWKLTPEGQAAIAAGDIEA